MCGRAWNSGQRCESLETFLELVLISIDISQNIQPGKVVAGNPMRIIRDVVPVPAQDDEYGRVEPAMLANMWSGERSYSRDVRMGM